MKKIEKLTNTQVKRKIADALFTLMDTKPLSDIHITEIVGYAKVSRSSFYRNYASKEDIIIILIQDILEEYKKEINLEQDFYIYENIKKSFAFIYAHKKYVLNLYDSGYILLLLEELNFFHESIIKSPSLPKPLMHMYIGAFFNTAIEWLKSPSPCSLEEISKTFYDCIHMCKENLLPNRLKHEKKARAQ